MKCFFHKHCGNDAVVRVRCNFTVVIDHASYSDHEAEAMIAWDGSRIPMLLDEPNHTYREHVQPLNLVVCQRCFDEFKTLPQVSNLVVEKVTS